MQNNNFNIASLPGAVPLSNGQSSPSPMGSSGGFNIANLPGATPITTPTSTPAANTGSPIVNGLKSIGNFLFPIVGDIGNDLSGNNKKTVLQQVGDLGLSALPFVPGLGEEADAARAVGEGAADVGGDIAADTATDGATDAAATPAQAAPSALSSFISSPIAKGAALGYGAGVLGNLSQGQGLGQAFIPNTSNVLGAVLGGVTPAVLNGIASKFGDQAAIDATQQAYEDAAGSTKTGIRNMSNTASKGLDPNPEFLANAGIAPETDVLNGRRVFTTGENSISQQALQSRLDGLTALRDSAIDATNATVNINDVQAQALSQANSEFSGTARDTAQAHINAEFDAYKSQYADEDGNVSLKDMNTIKKDLQGKTNYDATRPTQTTQANKLMANVAKETVEDTATDAGAPSIKKLNKLIQQHIDAKGFLDKINGQTVKGGRLGTYLSEGAGALVGGSIGNKIGGPIGEGVGGLAGGLVGKGVSNILQKFAVGGPRTAGVLSSMAAEDPEIVQKFLNFTGNDAADNIAPKLIPKVAKSSLIPTLTKAAVIGAAHT